MTWNVLDVGSIWIKEFASALSVFVPTLGWDRQITALGLGSFVTEERILADPRLRIVDFRLQRGYYRFPIAQLTNFGRRQSAMIATRSRDAKNSPLICTAPFYAAVAEDWPGPVIYYLTDFTCRYGGMNADTVRALDVRMCRRSDAVFPNSRRIGDYLRSEAHCSPEKIAVVPNATRKENVLAQPAYRPSPLPPDVAHLPRPIAGIIGNLAGNMDWQLLNAAIARTPWLTWLFIGPTVMDIPDPQQRAARQAVLSASARVHFAGAKPYGALRDYARAIDVAVLPYVKQEPTYSGSATRFYEHLAACRPILATRGVEELLHKEPLLSLIGDAEEVVDQLNALKRNEFSDGFEHMRWQASQSETWYSRAAIIRNSLTRREQVSTAAVLEIATPG